jgi:hypothetical protein
MLHGILRRGLPARPVFLPVPCIVTIALPLGLELEHGDIGEEPLRHAAAPPVRARQFTYSVVKDQVAGPLQAMSRMWCIRENYHEMFQPNMQIQSMA